MGGSAVGRVGGELDNTGAEVRYANDLRLKVPVILFRRAARPKMNWCCIDDKHHPENG